MRIAKTEKKTPLKAKTVYSITAITAEEYELIIKGLKSITDSEKAKNLAKTLEELNK